MDAAQALRHDPGMNNVHAAERPSAGAAFGHEGEENSRGVAHTLTACCRCRKVEFETEARHHHADRLLQRKTKCDATLPRCKPCERNGVVCEYYDTTRGRNMPRTYVIQLRERVLALERELGQLTEDEGTSESTEDIVRPGGLIRLDENDETPRYLGASSGMGITRLVIERAKQYTDTGTIRELVPDVRQRRTPAQSPNAGPGSQKTYPRMSAVAAEALPGRDLANQLVILFTQKCKSLLCKVEETSLATQRVES